MATKFVGAKSVLRQLIVGSAGLACLGWASAHAAPSLAGQRPEPPVRIPAEAPRLKLDARLDQTVWPRVALDGKLAPNVTGAIGFLCGREPGQTSAGSASAFGSDPHGRFLGARLSRAF